MLSNLSLFYRKLGLIAFNSTLIVYQSSHSRNLIILILSSSAPAPLTQHWAGLTVMRSLPFIPLDNWDSGVRHTRRVILVKLSTNQELIDQICFKQQSGDYKWFHVVFSPNIAFKLQHGHTFGKLSAEF